MPHQRKREQNCFAQGSYNFSHKKRRAKEAKPKSDAISYQRNHYLKELLTWMRFIVLFVTSIYSLSLNGILKFSNLIFVQVIPLLGLYQKIEEYTGSGCFWKIIELKIDRKIVELECPIKKKEDRIPLNKGPTIFSTKKGGPKKQTPGVLQFLSRITKILLYQTSIFALVLPFWFPVKERKDGIPLNKGPTISPTKKGGPKKQSPRVLQFLIKRSYI